MERTLLLVDDEPNVTKALERLLHSSGYKIRSANSGAKGLELLDKHKLNVIISDQRMPQMSGVEFLSQVRERWPDIVRIVLNAYADFKAATGYTAAEAIGKTHSGRHQRLPRRPHRSAQTAAFSAPLR